ncbi:MAG: hypothetical protein FWE97_04450, partial [Dehalococcoidia bacterium]|nr:hypothetical protein [Dehalococcoidia bacterium]
SFVCSALHSLMGGGSVLPFITALRYSLASLKHYTMTDILDKFDVIECFERPSRKLRVGEIPDKQKQLYLDLDIRPPSSL